jgi:hypothetical protein
MCDRKRTRICESYYAIDGRKTFMRNAADAKMKSFEPSVEVYSLYFVYTTLHCSVGC